jgi:hypothetical protein
MGFGKSETMINNLVIMWHRQTLARPFCSFIRFFEKLGIHPYSTVDPGEVLLRLVTQSAARAGMYAQLLEEAYEAAERLKRSFDAGALEVDESKEMAETAREDLDRIFNTGGVAALVGNTYGAAKDVGVYVTGEAIRRLADLEAKERERCANFASKLASRN